MFVKRCLRSLGESPAKFGLKLRVIFVPSERSKTGVLIRVKKPEELEQKIIAVCQLSDSELRRLHVMHNMGVNRTSDRRH